MFFSVEQATKIAVKISNKEIEDAVEKIAKENDLEKPTRKKRVTTKRKPRK